MRVTKQNFHSIINIIGKMYLPDDLQKAADLINKITGFGKSWAAYDKDPQFKDMTDKAFRCLKLYSQCTKAKDYYNSYKKDLGGRVDLVFDLVGKDSGYSKEQVYDFQFEFEQTVADNLIKETTTLEQFADDMQIVWDNIDRKLDAMPKPDFSKETLEGIKNIIKGYAEMKRIKCQ